MSSKELIYGKESTERIVGVEYKNGEAILFTDNDGAIRQDSRSHKLWMLHKKHPKSGHTGELKGKNAFNVFTKYDNEKSFYDAKRQLNYKDIYTTRSLRENYLIYSGATLYKGMKMDEVGILSFDIETSGLTHDIDSQVYLISNTFRINGEITKKLFSVDDYANQKEMIYEWCNWVRNRNPSIICGHNVLGFDLPYLNFCSGSGLYLGRDLSKISFDQRPRSFRKDGSQSYEYHNAHIFGREIVDTWMLSIKYDIGRRYPSYRLKEIIEYEGLTRSNRTFYEAGKIRETWQDLDERAKIKAYCMDDSDDALALVDLMLPSFFYYCSTLPMGLQDVILTASGSQVNSIMVRSYIQAGESIPEPSQEAEYQGAISFGNPGIHKHVNKVDVASLYPSIIISSKVWDQKKDPKGNFLKIDHFGNGFI